MKNPQKSTELPGGDSTGRRPYTKPGLREFGDVRNLTQAGTGAKTEQGQGVPPPKSRA